MAYVRAGRDCGFGRADVGGKLRVRRAGEEDWICGFGSTCEVLDAEIRVRDVRIQKRCIVAVVRWWERDGWEVEEETVAE